MLTPKLQMLEETIKRLIRRNASVPLEKVIGKTHTADLAFILGHLANSESQALLDRCADDEARAEILSDAEPDIAARVLRLYPKQRILDLLHRMEPDDVSDILEHMPKGDAEELLVSMRGKDRTEVEELSSYGSATAGGIMSPRYFALPRSTTAREAIEKLHEADADVEMAFYVYVINELGQLIGVVSLRQLVISKPDARLVDILTSDVISVTPDVDQEDVARLVTRYNLLAIPVVDESNKLLGICTIDDVIDVLREEATEDILRMGGMGGAGDELQDHRTVLGSAARRFPWLLFTGIGGALCALLLAAYADALRQFQPLVFFLPVVLGLAGVVGTQSATYINRSLSIGRLDVARLGASLLRQFAVGGLLGVVAGALMTGFCWIWLVWFSSAGGEGASLSALMVGAGIAGSMPAASLVGGVLPILFWRIRVDPALATGPFVAVAADLLGLLLYLSINSIAL